MSKPRDLPNTPGVCQGQQHVVSLKGFLHVSGPGSAFPVHAPQGQPATPPEVRTAQPDAVPKPANRPERRHCTDGLSVAEEFRVGVRDRWLRKRVALS